MKSWKTTVLGVVAAGAMAMSTMSDGATIAEVINALAVAALGVLARDNNVTSEAAGASKKS